MTLLSLTAIDVTSVVVVTPPCSSTTVTASMFELAAESASGLLDGAALEDTVDG